MTGSPDGAVYMREEQVEDLAKRVANKVVSLLASHAERIADDPPADGVPAAGGEGDPNAPKMPPPNDE